MLTLLVREEKINKYICKHYKFSVKNDDGDKNNSDNDDDGDNNDDDDDNDDDNDRIKFVFELLRILTSVIKIVPVMNFMFVVRELMMAMRIK